MDDIIYKIEDIVRECGKIMLNIDYSNIGLEQKEGLGNFVTKYDKLIQNKLKKELLSLIPTASFMGEENEENNTNISNDYTFVVDPIDGTCNFSRNMKLSIISVALLKNKKQYISVCFNPYLDEMYIAQKGKGAYLNGKRLSVSNKKIENGLLLVGSSPYYKDLRNKSKEVFNCFYEHMLDFRRTGSAAIDLCLIASGKAEVYFELILQPWDYVGASLFVLEAGGLVTSLSGKELKFDKPMSILATNNSDDYFKYIKGIYED